MSIQLDGHVTYPSQRRNGQPPGTDGPTSSQQEEEAAAATADGNTSSSGINWDGFWHYSRQKSKAGGPELAAFTYSFIGPVENGPPCTALPAAGAPGAASDSADTSQGARVPCRDASGDSSSTPQAEQSAAGGDRVAPLPAESSTINASPAEDAHTPATSSINSSVPRTSSLHLYGPGGDGMLPSGNWSGFFIVNYGRGVEVKVEETFVLDFGSKSPRSPTPLVAATTTAGQSEAGNTSSASPPAATDVPVAESSQPFSTPTVPESVTTDDAAGAAEVGGIQDPLISTGPTPADLVSREATPPKVASSTASTAAAAMMPPMIESSASPPSHVQIAPVVRVSGRGHNKYGEFTLTGGHERATGRLDLTRFYYEKPKDKSTAATSRAERSSRGVSHQKKRRPPPPGAPPPQPAGPSLAERRTKRTRCPNQRLMDEEESFHGGQQSDSAGNGGGGSGSSGPNKRKNSSGDVGVLSISILGSGGGGSGVAADTLSTGASTPKSRKPRDRERDLYMEQRRREKRKAEDAAAGKSGASAASNNTSIPPERIAAELAAKAKAGREVLAMIGNASADPVEKDAFAHMELEQADLEAEAAAAATAAAEATAAGGQAAALVDKALAENGGSGGWAGSGGAGVGGTGGSSGSRMGRAPGRSKRHSVERWEELTLDRETGEYYEGGWFRGRRHGKGLCVYANKKLYEGDWRAGKEHGVGKIMGADREVIYEGEFADGKLCGKGRYTDGTGVVYDGEWKDSAMHGRGVYTFPLCQASTASVAAGAVAAVVAEGAAAPATATKSGDTVAPAGATTLGWAFYDGEFKDNARSGRGLLVWPGGSYDGEWLDDAKHGRGVFRTDDGFVYDGQWVDDLAEGRGTCIHPDGQRYEGVFRGGKKEGRGTLAFANGASYEGRFRDDAIDGQGMLQIPRPVEDDMGGWMIPIQFQSDIERIHVKAGFDKGGL